MNSKMPIAMEAIPGEIRLAQQAFRSGNIAAAKLRVDNLYRWHPANVDVLTARAIILAMSGGGREALDIFRKLAEAGTAGGEALGWGSRLALDMNDFESADVLTERFVQVEPSHSLSHYYRANALRCLGRTQEGIEEIDIALQITPGDIDSLLTKAKLLEDWRLPSLAEDVYRYVLSLKPHPMAAIKVATYCLRDGRSREAIECIEKVERSVPDNVTLVRAKAEAYMQLRMFTEADRCWEKAARLTRDARYVWHGKALVDVTMGRFDVAKESLANLLDSDPNDTTAFSILTKAKRLTSDDRTIVGRMADIADRGDLAPEAAIDLNYALGKTFDDLKEYDRAIKYFDEANRICYEAARDRRAFDPDYVKRQTDLFIEWTTPEKLAAFEESLDSRMPIFVAGMIRSGTTLTETILSGHSLIKEGGEQSFWPSHGAEFLSQGEAKMLVDEKVLAQLGKEYLDLLSKMLVGSPKQYVVDKNPANFNLCGFLSALYPNAKIIHTKRNAVDTMLSIWTIPLNTEVRFANSRENIVSVYRQYLRLWRHFEKVMPPSRFTTISYESLTSDPETTITRIMEFLELEVESAVFTPEKTERAIMTPSVFQVRQPINRNSQERWRNYEPWLGEFEALLEEE